ncbi:MAG: glucose-1-phosphate cytidylyltransferase [Gammaproteobacteria bacterium]|nr:glucose-1-phosphate cytidylyltransferase [Gammaproteobacteria bacterium]
MKVVILAGGFGTRLSEETQIKPKPMVNIGNKPIIWHIMKIYSSYGFNEFVILLGYKGHLIKEYFSNFYLQENDVTIDTEKNEIEVHKKRGESWKITLLETGENSMTGGRIKYAEKYIGRNSFLLTYGDAVADVNIQETINFHQSHGKSISVTSVRPEGRFGSLDIQEDGIIKDFQEKPPGDGGWVNGGFFVCEPSIFKYISSDETIFEREPLEQLAKENEMIAYKHKGFWQPMDKLSDKEKLCKLWEEGNAPWKNW